MDNYPYTTNPARIAKFLQLVQTAKVPPKVTYNYLASVGFTSSNDRALIPIIKFIGFIDASHITTKSWQMYRDQKNAKWILAQAIKKGYSDLFSLYDDAYQKDDATLESFFSSKTSVGKSTIRYMMMTFKALCKLADFGMANNEIPEEQEKVEEEHQIRDVDKGISKVAPKLQLNVEIHIAADTSDDKIETIFKNMKKYLISNE
jgi:hypothetical protein